MNGLLYTTNGDKKDLPRIKCIKCGRIGNLTIKKTKTRGVTYQYYYVQHYIKETNKIEWCYLGSLNKLPEEYKRTLQEDRNYTQHYTQNIHKSEKTELASKLETSRAGSLARIGHEPPKLGVVGSNPTPPAKTRKKTQ